MTRLMQRPLIRLEIKLLFAFLVIVIGGFLLIGQIIGPPDQSSMFYDAPFGVYFAHLLVRILPGVVALAMLGSYYDGVLSRRLEDAESDAYWAKVEQRVQRRQARG